MIFAKGQRILFQGDSVTDCRRDRAVFGDLGSGYPMMIASAFTARHPELALSFLNRGISGDRSKDLAARWREDCLDLKPDWVSVLIGINDTWRRYDRNDPTSAQAYAHNVRDIFERTADAGMRLIVLEPFVLPVSDDRRAWLTDLAEKQAALRELARAYASLYVPLDGIFAAASVKRDMAVWAADGVHPTQAGHGLIAQAWTRAAEQTCGLL